MAIIKYEPVNTVQPGNDPSKPYHIVIHDDPTQVDAYERHVFLTVPNYDTAKLICNALNADLTPPGPTYT